MKTESNRSVNSHTQSMAARNDFPLLSHLSLLPLVSQSDKHRKEPMFLHLLCCISFIHHFLKHILCFKIHNLFYMADYLIEDFNWYSL